MTDLMPFAFEDQLVRIVTRDGEPWFVGNDVCRALDLKNQRDAMNKLDPDEKGVANADTLGGPQEMTIVSEAGVYRLVFASRKPEAERFKRWLAHEVLPAIRRTGRYAVDEAPPMLDPEERTERAQRLALDQVREVRITFGIGAARAVWKASGLPWEPAMETPALDPADAATDPVALFVRDGIERVPGLYTAAAVFWPAFVDFCAARDLVCPSKGSFQSRFGRMGLPKRLIGGRSVFIGLRPKTET